MSYLIQLLRLLQPLLELLQRKLLSVTLVPFFSGPLTPAVELVLGHSLRFDPDKPFFCTLAGTP